MQFLARLVELELIDRERRLVERRIKQAGFPVVKQLESFDFKAIPALNKMLVLDLARGEYIARRENVILLGPRVSPDRRRAPSSGPAANAHGREGGRDHRADAGNDAGRRDPLVAPFDGPGERAVAHDGPADMGGLQRAAAPLGDLQAVGRSAVRGQGPRHRRALSVAAGPRAGALCRRKEPDPGTRSHTIEVSPDLISTVTDAVLEAVGEWQNRPLDACYAIVFFDAIRVKIRDEGFVRNKAVYIALAILPDGTKEIPGLWIEQTEGAKFWLRVMNEIKNRGVQDILLAVVDGLKGFPEAINATFPETLVQTCIVHLIRHSMNFASWKDRKHVAKALRDSQVSERRSCAGNVVIVRAMASRTASAP